MTARPDPQPGPQRPASSMPASSAPDQRADSAGLDQPLAAVEATQLREAGAAEVGAQLQDDVDVGVTVDRLDPAQQPDRVWRPG